MTQPVWVLLKKELTEVLRDKRTLLITLGLPVVLYPALLTFIGAATALGKQRLATEELTVAIVSDDAAALVASQPPPAHTTFVRMTADDATVALREKRVAAAVDAPAGAAAGLTAQEQAQVTLWYTKRYDRSMEAQERLTRLLRELGRQQLVARLQQASLPAQFAEPVITNSVDIDFQRDLGPLIASRALPLILLLMLFMGALYSAVDLTAGEKERGTLETLLVAPVKPLQVMLAKYLTVTLTAVAATLANLAAMSVTFAFGLSLGTDVDLSMRLGFWQVAVLLVCLMPAAAMASGIALAVASLAKSFKEGQSLMTPVVMVAMAPGLIATMPGIELNPFTAAIPLVNLGLLVKATVLNDASALSVAIVFASATFGAYGSLTLAANAFTSEALRFGGTESWRELFRRRGNHS